MALETILSIVAEPLVQHVVTPTARHISYAFRCSSNIVGLRNQVERLKNKMLERQQLVDNATSNGEEIFPAVTEWLTAAGEEIEDAEQLIRGEAQAMMMNKCFAGLCPDMKARYRLSKRAHKKALRVSEKLQEAQDSGSGPVSFRPPLQQIAEPSVYSSEALASRVLILNQIMDALRDPGLNTIGVYGMGGIGKTTLAKEVKGRAAAQEKSLFETVVMVAVSQAPDLRRIQGEIADLLGLKFDGEEIPGRAYRLHKRLERAKALIILDDVWQRLDLTAVGVPLGGGCKILVTSRRKDVLSADMGTQKDFSLDALEEEETWRLFEMSTSSITDPELHQTAKEVAKKCAGLPLLILKVAADLRGKQLYAWTDMLSRLSSLENTEIYEKVHRVIELSYKKLLDEEAKSLFLLCALFGDSNIEIQRLVMYCVGLGLFKRIGTIEGSRNRVLSLIDKLKDECLLLDGDRAGFVKMHDVVHDIAVAIASRVQNAYVGAREHFRNEDRTRISFPRWDTSKLPGVLECPQAELISLFANGNPLDVSGSFFKGAPMLKVVDFTGVWFGYRLPLSLCYLTGLQTLCLQGCRFEDVAVVAQLKQLEVLSLAGSFFVQALPPEIKALSRLKLLDLSRCSRLKVIPANVLSNLSSLEELYMFKSFSRWEINGNASLEELKSLSHLKTLEIRVKDDKLIPKEWFFDGVENYKISIGRLNLLQDTARYKTSRKILQLELKTSTGSMHRIKEFVNGIEVLKLHDVGVETLLFDSEQHGLSSFGKLRDLGIFDCLTLKSLCSHSFAKYLPQLEALEVVSCAMEAIFGVDDEEEEIEFTYLKYLSLGALPNLISLSKPSGMVAFPNLTSLLVSECDGLKYMFTTSIMRSLKQLKSLCISHCQSMGEIISSEQIEEEKITRIVFPKLESLELAYLKTLKRFSSRHPIDFPSLRVLTIYDCPEIENLVSKFPERSNDRDRDDNYIFLNELVSLNNLEELEVSGVDNLRYLWSEGINIQNLRSITVRCCPRLRYVFRASVACGLHQLRLLRIQECGVYTIIAKEKDKTLEVKWPCLTDVEVRDCNVLFEFGSNNSELFSHVKECTLDDHSLQAIRSDGIRVHFLLREDKV